MPITQVITEYGGVIPNPTYQSQVELDAAATQWASWFANAIVETNLALGQVNASLDDVEAAESASADATLAQGYAEEWANKDEDVLVSTDAGGDGLDDYSALHHASKASASKSVAEAAQGLAEGARDASQAARDLSLSYRDAAQSAKTDAETAQAGAEAAEAGALSVSNATIYQSETTYLFPNVVIGSDGYSYRCLHETGISGEDPVGSETGNWTNLSGAGSIPFYKTDGSANNIPLVI